METSFEAYIKFSLFISVIVVIFLGLNNRFVSLLGLTLGIIGSSFLSIGVSDSLFPYKWSKDGQRPNLKRDYKHLFERDYGRYHVDDSTNNVDDSANNVDALTQVFVGIQVTYPVLRLKAAEFGPWLLLMGFLLQSYVIWIDP